MILSNTDIPAAIQSGELSIKDLAGMDVSKAPFNTSSVDLRLAETMLIPKSTPTNEWLDRPYDKDCAARNCDACKQTDAQPYDLNPIISSLDKRWRALDFRYRAAVVSLLASKAAARLRGMGLLVHHNTDYTCRFRRACTQELINRELDKVLLIARERTWQTNRRALSIPHRTAPKQFRNVAKPTG